MGDGNAVICREFGMPFEAGEFEILPEHVTVNFKAGYRKAKRVLAAIFLIEVVEGVANWKFPPRLLVAAANGCGQFDGSTGFVSQLPQRGADDTVAGGAVEVAFQPGALEVLKFVTCSLVDDHSGDWVAKDELCIGLGAIIAQELPFNPMTGLGEVFASCVLCQRRGGV